MSQRIPLGEEHRKELDEQTSKWLRAVARGEAPAYPEFVGNLFAEMPDLPQTVMHAAAGCVGEAGELTDAAKKFWAYRLPELDTENVIEELGDLRFYYQAMLNLLGMTDDDIQSANRTKLTKRYASGKFSSAEAAARADKQGDK